MLEGDSELYAENGEQSIAEVFKTKMNFQYEFLDIVLKQFITWELEQAAC